ncbi:cell division inhibitor SepF [Micromonospora pisi]|uniref:Cell division protein SepF n=1 Tax=Micromonospora pisi TaxID=589240 RepID=A0A495JFN3_9ACTN|nr:cell division protein SepF [Micromonospora pisi]RKR87184.1 cell division inhibitor SepF [Micromonospora pisi]
MGALRKAGVWLGLVEEDDERAYDDGYEKAGYRGDSRYRQSRYAEEFADEDDEPDEPAVPRARSTDRGRLSERSGTRTADLDRSDGDRPERTERPERGERASVRSITRPSSPEPSSALSYHTRDNLALAPQVQLRERSAPDEDQRYQITTLHPTTYREARTIGEHFRDGVPVIINLTEMDEADARRLVDFAAGLAFGLRGTIERVTNRVFLLSPANVQVTAEDKAKIAEGGFFSLS